jgi:hypothetical protein
MSHEDALNAYRGDNIWQDIIWRLPDFDYEATEASDRSITKPDRFIAGDKVYIYLASEDLWSASSRALELEPVRLENWGQFEDWLGNEHLSEEFLRLLFAWLEARGTAWRSATDGPLYIDRPQYSDNEWTNILREAFGDVSVVLRAADSFDEAERRARETLERLLRVYGPDHGLGRLNDEFLSPVDDEYGCYVGRGERGLGVSCPWWDDREALVDPTWDPSPLWVTVWADGYSE